MHPLFDSHAHYDHPRFDSDREALLADLPQRGVGLVVNIGADGPSSTASISLAERYDYIYATVGLHPHDATDLDEKLLSQLAEQCAHPKVVALGEIGLDYHYDFSPRDVQRSAFERQLELACALDIPVVIHSRKAAEDTYQLLERYRPAGIIHCFSGSAEMAEAYVKLGFYIGFTGVVTFKNAKQPLRAAAAVPLDRLLIETDCPYMAPEPFRGRRCDSTMLTHTAAALAALKGVDTDTLIRHSYDNARAVYRINKVD